jgi:hypothetical protein
MNRTVLLRKLSLSIALALTTIVSTEAPSASAQQASTTSAKPVTVE